MSADNKMVLIRAEACLWGGAVGDAVGKASEGYSPASIIEVYGGRLEGFVEPIQPLSQFTWQRAEVTEDTRQCVAVAKAIIDNQAVDQLTIARYLLDCDKKGIGPSSRTYHFILVNDIGHIAKKGSGTGAATRIAPLGLVNSSENLAKLVDDVAKATVMTHGGRSAIAGAAAMAAAISAALEGWPAGYVLLNAVRAAKLAEQLGYPDRLVPVSEKIKLGMDLAGEFSGQELWDRIDQEIGWGFFANEAVPAALITACTFLNARDAILHAVNKGGDADAIAGMAGALAGALNPESLPLEWIEEVRAANNLELTGLAQKLVKLRPNSKRDLSELSVEIGG
ncbi:MAG TPA: ADP-ribosylglycohydrolase family protein [Verrucomicrobiae bacterium]|nr:ADP-ribosylglycohydrolase family protein [Verrucomicrobiae bacterium]